MSKKSAIDLACDELSKIFIFTDKGVQETRFIYLPEPDRKMAKKWKKLLLEKAEIPDGWDIVKEIKTVVLNQMKEWDDDIQLRIVLEEIDIRLKQAGKLEEE